jgi:glycosyltransferase involved in cell wall biosynthesis
VTVCSATASQVRVPARALPAAAHRPAATATAEVVGAAGVLVDPTDSGSLAEGIRHLLDDAVAAGRFAAAGRARAGTLTWDAVAEQTVTVYRAALAA